MLESVSLPMKRVTKNVKENEKGCREVRTVSQGEAKCVLNKTLLTHITAPVTEPKHYRAGVLLHVNVLFCSLESVADNDFTLRS